MAATQKTVVEINVRPVSTTDLDNAEKHFNECLEKTREVRREIGEAPDNKLNALQGRLQTALQKQAMAEERLDALEQRRIVEREAAESEHAAKVERTARGNKARQEKLRRERVIEVNTLVHTLEDRFTQLLESEQALGGSRAAEKMVYRLHQALAFNIPVLRLPVKSNASPNDFSFAISNGVQIDAPLNKPNR